MSVIAILMIAVLLIAFVALPLRRREHVDRLLNDLDRTVDDEELTRAEDEVRDLDVMTTPEDAERQLPDWGPGVPRKKSR